MEAYKLACLSATHQALCRAQLMPSSTHACIMCGVHGLKCVNGCKQVMYECNRSRSEVLAEAVPEAMKNVLLVMATRGLLSPAWMVSGPSPWQVIPRSES